MLNLPMTAGLVAQSIAPFLDPPTRAVLLMSLLAFVLLGASLMAGAVLAGRWVRRNVGEDLREPLPLRRTWKPTQPPAGTMARSPIWGAGEDASAAAETVSQGALTGKTEAVG